MKFLAIGFASEPGNETSWSADYESDEEKPSAQKVADFLASRANDLYPTQLLLVRNDQVQVFATQENGDFVTLAGKPKRKKK